MTTSMTRGALACALLATTCLSAPALAQSAPPPAYVNADANGVDLATGKLSLAFSEGSIGAGEGAVELVRYWAQDAGWTDNWSGGMYTRPEDGETVTYVQLGDISDSFGSNGSAHKANGASLVGSTYTAPDGTRIEFQDIRADYLSYGCPTEISYRCGIPRQVRRPNGVVFNLHWEMAELCQGIPETEPCTRYHYRFKGVTSSAGYGFTISYATNDPGTGFQPVAAWRERTGVTFSNTAQSCGTSCPSVSYAGSSSNVTMIADALGRQTRITNGSHGPSAIKRPGSAGDSMTISYGADGTVSSVTRDGVTTGYARSVNGSLVTTTVTDALSQQTIVTSDLEVGRVKSVKDPLNRTTSYDYDPNGRLIKTTAPEGNAVQYSYDARGNVLETRAVAKSGSGLADIVASAVYPATCSNPKTCNKPTSTTDARGFTTDYAYNSTHGGLLSVTAPAPSAGAVRPQTRYSYVLTAAAWVPGGTSACATQSSCAGTADEVKTTVAYGANMLPVSTSAGAGDNSLTATSAMTYDAAGNLLTIDGPLPGAADTVRMRYDAARQRVGTVSPDPDGSGPLKPRAQRITYNADGQPTKVESGTVTDQSDAAWSAFASIEAADATYDSHGRKVKQTLTAGGTVHAAVEYSYDALGRPDCTAQRMNPASFGTLTNACTLTAAGSFGPDRIAKTHYDAAGQVVKVQSGYGTADQADEVQHHYSSNGLVQDATDANGNRSYFAYDGHDRLAVHYFPSKTMPGEFSLSDFEYYVRDAAGNVVRRILRDNSNIYYSYDALNRLTHKDMPGIAPHEYDIAYSYDLLGRMTQALDSNTHVANFSYDALGRKTSEQSNWTTRSWQHDLAGRRTRLTWGDGFYVTYDYNNANDLTGIRENGSFVLASFGYDDLGRRTSLTRGNGTVTGYGYDGASRLSSLTQDLGGSGYDLALSFAYNPAGQITSNTRSNDAFAWSGHGSGTTSSSVNGLNQLVTHGGVGISHDARGNLTHDGVRSFTYTAENRLATASGGYVMTYDPLGRFHWLANDAVTWMQYDGADIIEERTAGGVARRYVHGPGVDEPLVWYEGSGTGDKRFLQADERGSIVAVTDDAGSAIAINKYDEYGVPQGPSGAGTLFGRFGYTGQAWLPELGLYYFKARMYWPGVRFMQTDPARSRMNLYTYPTDPVNLTGPSGMVWTQPWTGCLIGLKSCGIGGSGSGYYIGEPPAGSSGGDSGSSRGGGGGGAGARGGSSGAPGSASTGGAFVDDGGIVVVGQLLRERIDFGAQLTLAGVLDTFSTSSSAKYGTYYGEDPKFCSPGRQVCTGRSGGVYQATSDFDQLRGALRGSPPRFFDMGNAGSLTIALPISRLASVLPGGGLLQLRVEGQVSFYGIEILSARAVIEIPRGALPGQIFPVRVHYYGIGRPPF